MPTRDATEELASHAPCFCPRCGASKPGGGPLCASCGDPVSVQGYCPVCERRWRARPGEPCPKHEIALQAFGHAETRAIDGARGGWTSIAAYQRPLDAHGPRIRLEAEGIPTFLDGEHVGGHGIYQVATGGVRLQVPGELADEARIILAQTWTPAAGDAEDLDDAWEELGPRPWDFRRSVMRALIVVFFLLPVVRWLVRLLVG